MQVLFSSFKKEDPDPILILKKKIRICLEKLNIFFFTYPYFLNATEKF